MEIMSLTNFYDHYSFIKAMKKGNEMIAKDEQKLSKMKRQKSEINIGDKVISTGKGSIIEGCQGLVVDK